MSRRDRFLYDINQSPLMGLVNMLLAKVGTSRLGRNMSITFLETVTTKGLNFLIILLLSRNLGPSGYGKYSFLFVMIALCSAVFDFGMENTAVRFAARERDKRNVIFGLYFITKLSILILLVLVFQFGGDWIFSLMGKREMTPYLPFLIFGLLGESLFFVNDTYLQAVQRFQLRAVLNIARYAVCLAYVGILLHQGRDSLEMVFYLFMVPLGFSLLFLPKYLMFLRAFFLRRLKPALFQEIRAYEKWMLWYSIANNLTSRIDFLILAFWIGFREIGIYNIAVQLCAIISFLPLVMGKVLLPTLAGLPHEEVFKTTVKMVRMTILMGAAAALLIPLSAWMIPLLLGEQYVLAIPVLQILTVAFIVSLISMPYEQALYSLGQPKSLSVVRYLQLGLMIVFNLLTIPLFGIVAAAFNMLLGRLFYLAYIKNEYELEKDRLLLHPAAGQEMGAGGAVA